MTKEYSQDRRAVAARRRRARERASGVVPVQIVMEASDKRTLEAVASIDGRPESDVLREIIRVGLAALKGRATQLVLGAFDRAS